jgi:hypothetical protein
MKLTREISFRPAYDGRSSDSRKDYGIHGADMSWYVKGPKGVIQFVVHTNWYLPHVAQELSENIIARPSRYLSKPQHIISCFGPQAADLGYHAKRRQYKGQTKREDCHLLKNGCYHDGSGLNAEPVLALLIEKGSDAVWARLEEEYMSRFGSVDLKEAA